MVRCKGRATNKKLHVTKADKRKINVFKNIPLKLFRDLELDKHTYIHTLLTKSNNNNINQKKEKIWKNDECLQILLIKRYKIGDSQEKIHNEQFMRHLLTYTKNMLKNYNIKHK